MRYNEAGPKAGETDSQKAVRELLRQEKAWAKSLRKIEDRELTEYEERIKNKWKNLE